MKILIATGIYPPDIGGIATYAEGISKGFRARGHEVRVVTYGKRMKSEKLIIKNDGVLIVDSKGNIFFRWLRYARALRRHGHDVDVVIALSSVSVGIPLFLSCLWRPKKILRLGGDFFWERYTDSGGMLGLTEWYQTRFGFWRILHGIFMEFILRRFHGLVYSTDLQKNIQNTRYILPRMTVIANAVPASESGLGFRTGQYPHEPFRLLNMGRFVGFKNLLALISAMKLMPDVSCTFVGSGPMEPRMRLEVERAGLASRVTFRPPVFGHEKDMVFSEHDLLIIPSTTDISPNVALEARVSGLPVLLTKQTGFGSRQTYGMILEEMRTPEQIADAVHGVRIQYDDIARIARIPLLPHDWDHVTKEWEQFLNNIV